MNASTTPTATALAPHFWFGRWVDNTALPAALDQLAAHLDTTLAQPFPFDDLLSACAALSDDLLHERGAFATLHAQACASATEDDARAMLGAVAALLQRDALQEKLRSELGTQRPGVLERRYPGRQYEAWMPAGCVVHVAPSNVFTVAALGLVEGLLAGNLNIVKASARDGDFGPLFAQALAACDPGGRLANYMAVLRLPSSDQALLQRLFGHADVISAWGGEKAIAAVRASAPAQARVVPWGHKVSFGYLAADCLEDAAAIDGFARDVCRLDQQACSSPQTLLAETDRAGLEALAERLAAALTRISPTIAGHQPDRAEQAEITTALCVARAEEALQLTRVIEAADGSWRILLDHRPGLRPSPLYRSIWLKSVQRERLGATLRPMRPWLQTCGLAAGLTSTAQLSRSLLSAGVSRITRPGEMIDSYLGAPHDGVYALQHLSRRVSVDGPAALALVGSFDALEAPVHLQVPAVPILDKSAFQALSEIDNPLTGVVVRSGGSSGKIAYSAYRWSDYHEQMSVTANGLVAAGLEPATDRVMNLFAAGYLYGSFISFWTILEHLRVRQYPMAMVPEYDQIADQIAIHQINTLVGMTPHLLGLFAAHGPQIKAAGCIKKVFYGGEALSPAQQRFLQEDCGVQLVRSVVYGSNDAGPMGYQCEHSQGGVHHLFTRLQTLEIVQMDADVPVQGTEIGRLLLTPHARSAPLVARYEIGDAGRWVPGPCACGRQEPRFELTGRLGDVFKVGGMLLNYGRFVAFLSAQLDYAGPVQIHLDTAPATTVVRVCVDDSLRAPPAEVAEQLMQGYDDLAMARTLGLPLVVRVEIQPIEAFDRIKASGKLRHVCDHRMDLA